MIRYLFLLLFVVCVSCGSVDSEGTSVDVQLSVSSPYEECGFGCSVKWPFNAKITNISKEVVQINSMQFKVVDEFDSVVVNYISGSEGSMVNFWGMGDCPEITGYNGMNLYQLEFDARLEPSEYTQRRDGVIRATTDCTSACSGGVLTLAVNATIGGDVEIGARAEDEIPVW
jgi:hypothetical protein